MNDTKADYWPLYEFWFGAGALDDSAYASARMDVWFDTNPDYDQALRERFSATVSQAANGGCEHWRQTLRGSLSYVILLDQIPRNLYRGTAAAFRYDAGALAASRSTLAHIDVTRLHLIELMFLYMPFEHAEDIDAQETCVASYRGMLDRAPPGLRGVMAELVQAGEDHCAVIRRFGRFPHRNVVLGRDSTPEEISWAESHHGWGQRSAPIDG